MIVPHRDRHRTPAAQGLAELCREYRRIKFARQREGELHHLARPAADTSANPVLSGPRSVITCSIAAEKHTQLRLQRRSLQATIRRCRTRTWLPNVADPATLMRAILLSTPPENKVS